MNNLSTLAKSRGLDKKVTNAIDELLGIDAKITHLTNIQTLLFWDQEIIMPKKGIGDRSEQISVLEGLIYEEEINPRTTEILHLLGVSEDSPMGESSLPEEIGYWLRTKYRNWKRTSSLPCALLQEIVKLSVESHCMWVEAREKNDFSIFAPYLEKTIALQKDKADCLGYADSRYDALLELYEPGATTQTLTTVFDELHTKLMPVFFEAKEKYKHIECESFRFDKKSQEEFCAYLMQVVGFEKDMGRLDVSTHPFSSSIGRYDARITTRYIEDMPFSSIFSVLHELGHAHYDLGIADMYRYTVCDEGASFGIHESQSRFLENIIGRSRAFWTRHYSKLQECAPVLKSKSFDEFMNMLFCIKSTPIRIESDEISYGLHIIIRFELERDIIEDRLSVKDLPAAWNEKVEKYLGIKPSNASEGVLQDVHWSEGYFGYFPSYELGNLYSVSLLNRLKKEMPDYEKSLEEGDFTRIKNWLGKTIHTHGASKLPQELLSLSVDAKIDYLRERYL